MTTHDESPIIRTTTKRMAQGLAIIVIVMAAAAAIAGLPLEAGGESASKLSERSGTLPASAASSASPATLA